MTATQPAPSAVQPRWPAVVVAGEQAAAVRARLITLLVAGCITGLALRIAFSRSALWLDEAQTVAIARLPLTAIPAALRHDGSPPLYYWLLHGWLAMFGGSSLAVRSLSVLVSVLTWPVLWLLTRTRAGDDAAIGAVLIVATSPFAIFFATEARPYALVMLLTATTALLVSRLLISPSWRGAAGACVATAALLLTHYWAGFVVAVLAGALWLAAAAGWRRRQALTAAAAVTLGFAALLPWAPVLMFQLRHTGTPWGKPPTVTVVAELFAQWSAPAQTIRFRGLPAAAYQLALVLACLCFVLAVLAVTTPILIRGRPIGPGTRSGRNLARITVGVCFAAMLLAVIVSQRSHGGYEPRYTAPMFLAVPIAAAIGAYALPPKWRTATVVLVCGLGVATAMIGLARPSKTQAGRIAAAIAAQVRPGDVVVYCPDQLGPAVHRLLPGWVPQLPFPTGGSPAVVDWVDYATRNTHASPAAFAAKVRAVVRHRSVWLVDVPHGYATFGDKCGQLAYLLAAGRHPSIVVRAQPDRYYEFANLLKLTAGS